MILWHARVGPARYLVVPALSVLPVNWMAPDLMLLAAGVWLTIGLTGGLWPGRARPPVALYLLGAAVALAVGLVAAAGLTGIIPLTDEPGRLIAHGPAGVTLHARLDALSAFFAATLGLIACGISVFAAGYFGHGDPLLARRIVAQYHLFLASMLIVLIADDTMTFMIGWELMTIASFLLIATDTRDPEARRAGYLYLVLAHLGALAILSALLLLQVGTLNPAFAAMRGSAPAQSNATLIFLLALLGFGAKAGLLPLHAWLPEAHPAAPSPVSALMSAVMLKMAIYGLLRVIYDLMQVQTWWWGSLLLGLGLASALVGVVQAAVQTDMKRLLAWSSIENLGLIACGLGLAILFSAHGMQPLAALALTAALCHVFAHASFKGLLFLGTGAVLHATGERQLGRLGGLIGAMPSVAWCCLIGALTSAALPPTGGFVAEWLLLQSFLFTPGLPDAFLNMLIPVVAAVIALASALAGFTMVKFFGVVFLGKARSPEPGRAREPGWPQRAGLIWLALMCTGSGLAPGFLIQAIDPVTRLLAGAGIGPQVARDGLFFAPVDIEQASYAPLILLTSIVLAAGLVLWLLRIRYPRVTRRSAPWNCGYPIGNARMQDSAEGFGQPIRQIFSPLLALQRQLPHPRDESPRYDVQVGDRLWQLLYVPAVRLWIRIGERLERHLPQRIAACLIVAFVTMIVVLAWVER